ncbi:DUF1302 family protein [Marinobacter lipolyticus]|nr:DUF1302 family protein [Marinobacter lipolyticus]
MQTLSKWYRLTGRGGAGALITCMALGSGVAHGADEILGWDTSNFRIGGYVRAWTSFNLQNPPETPEDDRWDPSMVRGSLMLDADLKTGPLYWKAIGRADAEYKTDYLERLEDQNQAATPGGPGSDLTDTYNQGELREFYFDYSATDRVRFRVGKQQVVWGETDFFRAMDVVHGFDYRWRSFLEPESDELRKPLILVDTTIDIPEAGGSLQLLLRPGLDRDKDIGNTYDLFGGRWALQPNKGIDFLAPGLLTTNHDHSDGDADDPTGGVRWSGFAGGIGYSIAYLKTFNNDPVVNSAFAPYKEAPEGTLGDFIHPEIDLFGVTLNGYVPSIDSVLSTEIVYTKDAAFNVGTNFFGGALPGFGGIKKKDVLQTMVRLDKNLNLQSLLGTQRPSFFSVQVFDKWIQSYDRDDDIVELVGFGAPIKEHTTLLTAILGLNYKNDSINPMLAVGTDLSNGGGFVIPSVEFVMGDSWRLRAEADLFFHDGQKEPGEIERDTHLFGGFANNNQLLFRLTRQF